MTLAGWKFKTDNKMRGAYGETDYDKKTIRVNKKRHKSAKAQRINKNAQGKESIIDTIVHEKLHAKHPKMHEKTVRTLAKAMVARMPAKQKAKHYQLFA